MINNTTQPLLYHGSDTEVKEPDLAKGRKNIDFGQGFYLTHDKKMAEKWASNKKNSIVNQYNFSSENLNILYLKLNKQWLEFIAYNRGFLHLSENPIANIDDYDIIVGPTADDKMFNTLSAYFNGFLSVNQTIQYLTICGYANQTVFKTEKALKNLTFVKSEKIYGWQKTQLQKQVITERKQANQQLEKFKQKYEQQQSQERGEKEKDVSDYGQSK